MDMRIAGTGKIPEGEYNKIKLSGSTRLFGLVKCASFSSAGTSRGESIECNGELRVSGKSAFFGNAKAKIIRVSGSFSCGGETEAEEISIYGKAKCVKSVKCKSIKVFGSLSTEGDIHAESVKAAGAVNCGSINSEIIEIQTDKSMNIGKMSGRKITVGRKRISILLKRRLTASSIEGDEIFLEYVTCPFVKGRSVKIGKGCKIGLVQYSEEFSASPKAKIENTEKR